MEFKSGFDATPYIAQSSWGKPKYKKVTDPDTGQKVYTGNGLDIHPNKKDRYKLQSEKDPDVRTIVGPGGSGRAAVAIKRRKGSDYIPVIEARAKVVEVNHVPHGELEGMDRGITYSAEDQAIYQRNARRVFRGVIATDTPEYAYKVFRLLTSDIVEHAKSEGLTPAQFYQQFNAELYRIANDAASQTGVEREQFAAYIREHAPKVADAIAGKSDIAKAKARLTVEELNKKRYAALRRLQKAQNDVDELTRQLDALIVAERQPEPSHEFYPEPAPGPESVPDTNCLRCGIETDDKYYCEPCGNFLAGNTPEPKPERSSPMRKSKKQQQREARREKRRAKRSGRKTSERMAA